MTDPDTFVARSLDGFVRAHADEVAAVDGGVVRAAPLAPGTVAVLIGGGSGHYPAFAGYVGAGMAAGAICGNIFTSPSTAQALRVAHAAEAGGGVLFTYGNYAGDVIHFGEAARRLRAEGIDARTVLITDDIASAPRDAVQERRGIAGIVSVFHLAGAAAERGDDLDEVERIARLANDRTFTHGVAFAGCTMPGAEHPLFEVPPGMMSIGLGIHGEPGVRDVPMQSAPDLARTLIGPLLEERPGDASRVVVLVNGLGAVAYEELYLLYAEVEDVLHDEGVPIADAVVGDLVTSLDMAGVSLTFLWLDDELEELWRSPASAPAFRRGSAAPSTEGPGSRDRTRPRRAPSTGDVAQVDAAVVVLPASRDAARTARRALETARQVIAVHAGELGELDAIAGDGDHGVGMLRGLTAAVSAAGRLPDDSSLSAVLTAAGDDWAEVAGGTSGALWGAALASFGESLDADADYSLTGVARAVTRSRERIVELGGANPGDKTMIDALIPFEAALAAAGSSGSSGSSLGAALAVAARAAAEAAAATADLTPRRGRARPLAERSMGHPDPGATSFSIIVDALARRSETKG
ncbi:dihydroxyacetone kinase family protein [Microbacterium sp. SLBN-146]|uniref:dihydroxyacetone kinase family protein n=1 Tax=Microbacterium sp. SLBN-146 TaxID=2768457 RepID=UPI0028C376CE|nr:dihydroxyacetone kinase family protein [Microbacterium sp. SLBN-146]